MHDIPWSVSRQCVLTEMAFDRENAIPDYALSVSVHLK